MRSWIEKSLKLREMSSGCVVQQLNQRNTIVFLTVSCCQSPVKFAVAITILCFFVASLSND